MDDAVNERQRDSDGNPFKITRGVPVWGILGVIGGIAFQAVVMYGQVANLTEKQADQQKSISALAIDIRAIVNDLTTQKIENVKRDMAIEDMRARLVKVEAPRR